MKKKKNNSDNNTNKDLLDITTSYYCACAISKIKKKKLRIDFGVF